MENGKYIYMLSEQNFNWVRIGITTDGKRDFSSPQLDSQERFYIRNKKGRDKCFAYLSELLENGYPLLTPEGLKDLEEAKKYLGLEDITEPSPHSQSSHLYPFLQTYLAGYQAEST